MPLKVSRNISNSMTKELDSQGIRQDYMAEDLQISKQSISGFKNGSSVTPENAVKCNEYFNSSEFSQAMGTAYFGTLATFSTQHWAKGFQNSPYATRFHLTRCEHKREKMGDNVFNYLTDDRSTWSKEQVSLADHYLHGLLMTASLSMLMATQFSKAAHYDLKKFTNEFNRKYGKDERK